MLRLALLLAIVVAVSLATWQIVQTDAGTVRAEWFGWRIDTSMWFVVVAFAASLIVALPLLRLLLTLVDAPGRLGKASQRARIRRGQEALALGLIAAEAGEFDDARKHAAKAEDLIEEPRLATLLQARAAEVAGDVAGAERAYSGMLANEDTELLGRKGLLQAALKRGDRIAAMSHAEAALRLSKASSWPFHSLFDLKVQAGDWEGAIEALDQGEKRKLIEDRVARRRRGVLLTAAASRAERERRMDKASDLAQKGFRIAPGFAPAAAMAARLLVAEAKHERAAAVLEEAWENGPHPVLAHAYRDLKVGEGMGERAQRMQSLAARRPDHREGRIVAAELAMERGDWSAAQAALEDAYREFPSARICTLYAAVARGRGDEASARTWIAQAASAPREADWSDLDPEGPAFLYDDPDWARLVYAFGDGGQLIHPRLEQGRELETGYLALPPASAAAEPVRPPPDTIVEARTG
jgi:HemY protein